MADVSENHKYVKNRVYIRYPLETIQYSTCYICDSFSDHPQNDFKTATVIKRLESNQERTYTSGTGQRNPSLLNRRSGI